MAPLLHYHLKRTATAVPGDCLKQLAGLTLRHRRANQLRNALLVEYLLALQAEGIEALVLKGAALANTVYPRPGLRPMRDIDILVPRARVIRAQQVLRELGFEADVPQADELAASHQLPVAQRVANGLTVSIELHHWLLPISHQARSQAVTFEMLRPGAREFRIDEVKLLTLGHEDMLFHIYRHSMSMPLIAQPVRLIWMADLTSLVEKYLGEIDWDKLRSIYPEIWNILPLFHFVTPWSQRVLDELQLAIEPAPGGAGIMFQGWPQSSMNRQLKKGLPGFLRDTFWPSEWWTRLYYGVNRQAPRWWWTRMVRHPLHVGRWVLEYVLTFAD